MGWLARTEAEAEAAAAAAATAAVVATVGFGQTRPPIEGRSRSLWSGPQTPPLDPVWTPPPPRLDRSPVLLQYDSDLSPAPPPPTPPPLPPTPQTIRKTAFVDLSVSAEPLTLWFQKSRGQHPPPPAPTSKSHPQTPLALPALSPRPRSEIWVSHL